MTSCTVRLTTASSPRDSPLWGFCSSSFRLHTPVDGCSVHVSKATHTHTHTDREVHTDTHTDRQRGTHRQMHSAPVDTAFVFSSFPCASEGEICWVISATCNYTRQHIDTVSVQWEWCLSCSQTANSLLL